MATNGGDYILKLYSITRLTDVPGLTSGVQDLAAIRDEITNYLREKHGKNAVASSSISFKSGFLTRKKLEIG